MCKISKEIGILVVVSLLICGLACPSVFAQLEIIAFSGDAAPDSNGIFSNFVTPALNATGQTAFVGFLTGTTGGNTDNSGIFLGGATGGVTQIARAGAAAPDSNGTFNGFGTPALNATGQTAFSGSLTGTTGGNADNSGIFLGGATGGVTQIAREGAAAPDSNGVFSFFGSPALNATGQTAFSGSLTGTTGGNADNSGIFLGGATGGVTQIAREGAAAPDSNGTFNGFNNPALNVTGQTAFRGTLTGTTGGGADDSGIFLGVATGGVTQIAREGDAAPDSNGVFSFFGSPALNATGQTAFSGSLTGTTGGANNGIFLGGATGGVTQIARGGAAAPDSNGTFSGFGSAALNATGQTAFVGSLTGTTGGATDDSGIFLGGATGGVTQIVREGAAAPDSNGTFNGFGNPALNATGQTAFVGTLTGTTGSGDETGLYVSAFGRLLQVARTNVFFDGSTIVNLSLLASPTLGSGLNDLGQIAYFVSLGDGRQAVMRNTIVVAPNWANTTSGDWDTGSNWEGGIAPHSFHETSINPAASLTVTGPAGPRTVHTLELGTSAGGQAELVLQNDFSATNGITIGAMGKLTLSGQSVEGVTTNSGAKIGGFGMVFGTSSFLDAVIQPSGNSFVRTGPLDLGTNSAAVASLGFANLGSRTTLGGGILTIPSGLFLQGATSLEGEGVVDGKIAAAFGSTIRATGTTLVLGDANSFVGFHSDGELYTGGNIVEIYDRNEAVLGSLTTLGDGASGGTLAAGTAMVGDTHPHFLVEQGKNVTGRGTIEGNFKNNGHVIGDGTATGERIVFGSDWTVSGIGTFENTLVMGTFAPGLSPAIVSGENFAFGGIVEIELGGTMPGSGSNSHDQIVDLGSTQLIPGVDLVLKPWNGFEPEIGDEFEILTWSENLVGQFTTVLVDPYFAARGINFELDYGDNSLTAVAVTALPGDFDLDGDVDGRDFLAWQRNPSIGNLANWQANYGLGGVSTATNFAVPEPSSLLLGLFTVLSFSFRGHKRAAQRLPRRSSEAGSGAWQFRIDANQPMAI